MHTNNVRATKQVIAAILIIASEAAQSARGADYTIVAENILPAPVAEALKDSFSPAFMSYRSLARSRSYAKATSEIRFYRIPFLMRISRRRAKCPSDDLKTLNLVHLTYERCRLFSYTARQCLLESWIICIVSRIIHGQ